MSKAVPILQAPDPEFVRVARERLRLTQDELAGRLGLSRMTINRYENGWPVPERARLAIKQLLALNGEDSQ